MTITELNLDSPTSDENINKEWIESRVNLLEQIILQDFLFSQQKTLRHLTEPKSLNSSDIEVDNLDAFKARIVSEHTSDYLYIRSQFEKNPYCLPKIWYSDIYYLCQETRKNLFINNKTEAFANINDAIQIWKIFTDLQTIPHDPQINFFFELEESLVESHLKHLWLPKIYKYCSLQESGSQDQKKIETGLKHLLSKVHRQDFMNLLIEQATLHGKWDSIHSITLSMQRSFNSTLQKRHHEYLNLLIEGRKFYIQLFTSMKKRIHSACKERTWLKSINTPTNTDLNASKVLKILECLISEQTMFLDKCKHDLKFLKDKSQQLNFKFLARESYSRSTLTDWIKKHSPELKTNYLNIKKPSLKELTYEKTDEIHTVNLLKNYDLYHKDSFRFKRPFNSFSLYY